MPSEATYLLETFLDLTLSPLSKNTFHNQTALIRYFLCSCDNITDCSMQVHTFTTRAVARGTPGQAEPALENFEPALSSPLKIQLDKRKKWKQIDDRAIDARPPREHLLNLLFYFNLLTYMYALAGEAPPRPQSFIIKPKTKSKKICKSARSIRSYDHYNIIICILSRYL